MGRHQTPRYQRRRLAVAVGAAVATVAVTVAAGIYGSALADDVPAAAPAQECLPDVTDPAVDPATAAPAPSPEEPPPAHGSHGASTTAPAEKGPEPAVQPPEPPPDATVRTFGAPGCTGALGPFPDDFVTIRRVRPNNPDPRPGRGASTGTFTSLCGTNANGHNDSSNFIVSPGVVNGAHHLHDYVGNTSTDAFSTDESLRAGGTTCRADDRSVYFWPVLRVRGRGGAPDAENPHNVGTVLRPATVTLQFRGNARAKVVPMPDVLRLVTGDAKAHTNGPAAANAKWTCAGFPNRFTAKYPLCPRGSQVQRVLDFPSCWDGVGTDSPNHRTHVLFPGRDGACPAGTRAVPQLRMTLGYAVPRGAVFAVDAFPDQLHDPSTDHADFANVMPPALMQRAVACINSGRNC